MTSPDAADAADEVDAALADAADAVVVALDATTDWGLTGEVPGQHRSDLAADVVAVASLVGAGLGVLSEESGRHHPDRGVTVVLDPLDGSTNAAHRVSWWAVSLCAVDEKGPLAALVVDLVHGTRFRARRGRGATRDGQLIRVSGVDRRAEAMVGLNGLPSAHLGWRQFRALGSAALDLCAVAEGALDAYVDCTDDGLAPWDYLGAALVLAEAGGTVADLHGRPLADLGDPSRRTIVAAASAPLAERLAAARRTTPPAAPPG